MENMKEMDGELEKAAVSGEVSFLKDMVNDCRARNDYSNLLSRSTKQSEEDVGNILHLAAWNGQEVFFKEAANLIPEHVVRQLLCHQEPFGGYPGYNPLHVAAYIGHLGIIKIIRESYRSITDLAPETKPWLAKDSNDSSTPLHMALQENHEDCALEILSIDMESLCTCVDIFDNTPLFLALKLGHNQVALNILTSQHDYSVTGEDGLNALRLLPNCSEEVRKELVVRRRGLIKQIDSRDNNSTILHQWVKVGDVSMFKHLVERADIGEDIKKDLIDLIMMGDIHGNNPFHIAVDKKMVEASKTLANIYKKIRKERGESESLPPWLKLNNTHKTPMDLALDLNRDALDWLTTTFGDTRQKLNVEPLFLAVKNGKTEIGQQIWDAQVRFGWRPFCPPGQKIWQLSPSTYSEEATKWLAKRLPHFISDTKEVKEALLEASEKGYDWLVTPMIKKHPLALKDNSEAWLKACENGHLSTLLAFIDNCPNFRELCLETKTTPLHHINLNGYEQYRQLVENSVMKGLRNYQDKNGATPLHQAIKDGKIELTEVLLTTDGVSRSLKDLKHKTPMALLYDRCLQDSRWDDMCKRNGIIPGLKTQYFQDKANIYEVRNTLSVVAALLATITFTAGFTVPGGFNNETGQALLGDKAAFIVFIVADAFAMFCSMVMLVCLMWSMVCDHAKSLMLIDRSMPILLGALVSTIVAFITGVYTVLRNKCLWVAIVIIVMCSLFILTVFKTFVIWLLEFFSPVTNRKVKDPEKGPTPPTPEDNQGETTTTPEEEGQTTAAQEDGSLWIHRKLFNCFRGRRPQLRKFE